jgi:hypothetical protein
MAHLALSASFRFLPSRRHADRTILEGFSIKGGIENGEAVLSKDEKRKEAETNVKEWLQKLKLMKGAS